MRFLGITLHNERWYPAKNDGKSCRRTSKTRRVPLYKCFIASVNSFYVDAARGKGINQSKADAP